jgi:NAD(P)-dependent dehydrogenase (short-subunit alcohol dehydrogenase family)
MAPGIAWMETAPMLIGTLDDIELQSDYPELTGQRVLITGVSGPVGVDIVRAFAEAGARLVVQADEDGPETQALAEIIAPYAMDVKLYSGPLADQDAKLQFAREAAQKFGGLDCVVNIAHLPALAKGASEEQVEALIAATLAMPVLTTRVAANRMRTMMTPGAIITVLAAPHNASGSAAMLAGIARSALASFTKGEAERTACDDIRINAIVPAGAPIGPNVLSGTADVASMALYLASGRNHDMSGLVFEAWCG